MNKIIVVPNTELTQDYINRRDVKHTKIVKCEICGVAVIIDTLCEYDEIYCTYCGIKKYPDSVVTI